MLEKNDHTNDYNFACLSKVNLMSSKDKFNGDVFRTLSNIYDGENI